MKIKISYSEEFEDIISEIKNNYPEKILELEGISEDQLDISKFSKKFFTSNNTADISIDTNANVTDNSIITYQKELPKALQKLDSYYILWKELKKLYGGIVAKNAIIESINGSIYIHDLHGIGASKNYCFNFSCYDIMISGLPMITKIKSLPPKHLFSFKSQLEQFVIIAANSIMGAVGLADIFLVMSYYVKNAIETLKDSHFTFNTEEDVWNYVRETIVSFIYTVNQPMRGADSPFTNVSIYDDEFLNSLKENYIFPDGSTYDNNIVKKIQEIYLDVMNSELERTAITFPVTTACFSIDINRNINDKNFLRFISEKNKKFAFINIYIGTTSILSSCCFAGSQKVLIRSSDGAELIPFNEIVTGDKLRRNLTVYHNGSWSSAKLVKLKKENKKMYRVVTSNNKEILVTEDHLHVTLEGEKETLALTTDDYLAFNTRPLDSFPEKCKKLTYAQGFLLGIYLGDGSKYKRRDSESYSITFSLNESNTKDLKVLSEALVDWNIDKSLHIHMQNNTMNVTIYSKELFFIIEEYINENYAHEKTLNNNIFLQSYDFRKGICFGWYASDGGNSNRIYTSSENIITQAEALFSSIGINTIVNISDRVGDGVVYIRNKSYNRNHPLFCIRWYSMKNKRSMGEVYKVRNNTEFFKIKSIEEYVYEEDYVYCFQMKNDEEPYFTLPNGIITHNCRLRSDSTNEYFNSFGSGNSKIGSLGVCTLNLPRISFTSKNKEEFITKLRTMSELSIKINNAKRNLSKKRIENGYLPLYTLGFMDLKKQYSTIGINGFNECLEILGIDVINDSSFGIEILDIISEINKRAEKKYNYPHNVEQVPAENVAIKLAEKDRVLGYNKRYKLYSNQFIPLTTNADLLDRIKLQGIYDSHFSGGAICHLNVEEEIEDTETIEKLIEYSAKQGVIYFAINYIISECKSGHITVTKNETCPICKEEIITRYTRVVGFLTATKNWAKERRVFDFPKRVFYENSINTNIN
jgi:anaerobic ribonucleoside-triphosphate reductase